MTVPDFIGVYLELGNGASRRVLGPGDEPDPPSWPGAPLLVETEDASGFGTVRWEPPAPSLFHVDRYRVQWATVVAGEVGTILDGSPDLSSTDRSYVVVVGEGRYVARVSARNSGGWGEWSTWVPFESEPGAVVSTRPQPPTGLTVTDLGNGTYRGEFVAPPAVTPPLLGYYVTLDGEPLETLPATARSFTTPEPGDGAHVYGVAAFNDEGSSPEVTRTVTVSGGVGEVSPPRDVTAAATFDGAVVTWSASLTPGVIRYELIVDGNPDTTRSVLATATLRTTYSGLLAGEHVVAVVAIHSDGRRSAPVAEPWYIVNSNGPVVEYRTTSGDNKAGFVEACRNAGAQGKRLRVVGDGLAPFSGNMQTPHSLRELEYETGVGWMQTASVSKGTTNRSGTLGPAIPVSRMTQWDNTITVPNPADVIVGRWYYVMASNQTSHKQTYPCFIRKVTGKTGTTVELDLDLHRSGSGYMRMHLINWAPSLLTIGGRIEHQNQLSNTHWLQGDALVDSPMYYPDSSGQTMRICKNGSGAYWGICNLSPRGHFYFSGLVDDENGRRYGQGPKYGYGISEQGSRDFEYWPMLRKEARFGDITARHVFTTAQVQAGSGFNSSVDSILTLKGGDSEHGKIHYDAEDATSTTHNPHEPGWRIGYGGRSVRPGRHRANGSTNTQEGAGHVFHRDRGAYVLPEGFVGIDSPEWMTAAVEVAERVGNQPATGWSMDEAPHLDNMVISLTRYAGKPMAGLIVRQKTTLGGTRPLVFVGDAPLAQGVILPDKWASVTAGTTVTGRVELNGSVGVGVLGASRLGGKQNIVYGPGVKTKESG